MNNRPFKLIKKEKLKDRAIRVEVDSAPNPNRWSKAVRVWVSDFQRDRRVEILQNFDSLFKDNRL